MSTPIETGLRAEYIRKQLVQAVFAADYSAAAITAPFVALDGTLAAIPAAYLPVGYTSEDGSTFTSDLSMVDVTSSQSVEPTRSDVESDVISAQFSPQETNAVTTALYEGLPLAGTGALPAVGTAWSWNRDVTPQKRYRRLLFIGLDYNDAGGEIYVVRFFPRALVTSKDDEQWARSSETLRPLTVTAYRDSGTGTSCSNWIDGPGWRALT